MFRPPMGYYKRVTIKICGVSLICIPCMLRVVSISPILIRPTWWFSSQSWRRFTGTKLWYKKGGKNRREEIIRADENRTKFCFCLFTQLIKLLKPDTYIMYRQYNIQQFYVLPTQCIYVYVWISEQTAIISLYSTNWLVFITEI